MSEHSEHIQKLETIVERCEMSERSEYIQNFEKSSKFHMCEQSSHIRKLEGIERFETERC